ncbi:ribonuclease J [Calidifontibacillus oryziterrae]|uniref:ribonuclease J n=1 Tax=Calidifontibacillus oryziterrae TaxID=1191699 RepID=UPI0002E7C47C|nr:ribonuclease J [Calidifontibacillus oryziterrae]
MFKKDNNPVRIFALGGLGEIGKNMYIVEVGPEIYVIDAGLKFPEDEMLGIDIVIPDITYLIENQLRIKGIFLTHGHEDHIGAISYVLRSIKIPIYGTKLTLGLVEDQLMEAGIQTADLREIHSETVLEFEHASVSFFRTTHSIPDSVGIVVHTPDGAIVNTGDFKFDQTPVDGIGPDYFKMSELGEKGVLCLMSDSTNADHPGFTGSEGLAGEELSDSCYSAEGRVIVASFASNIHRIQQVLDAAVLTNRKVAIIGKNMRRVIDISMGLGYISAEEDLIIPVSDIGKLPDDKIVLLTTGGQGEPLVALGKMATKTHKQASIKQGDTVIIAFPPLPGHEKAVSKTIDQLFRAGANVIYGGRKIQVSGHASQEELKMMLGFMKPQYFIPIHGDYSMQQVHGKLAEATGMDPDQIYLLENGEVFEYKNQQARINGKVPSGNVLIDGLGIGDVGNIVLRDRRLLSQDGILIVVVTLCKEKKQIVSGPEIISRGFVYVRESEELFEKSNEMVEQIITKCMKDHIIDWSTLKTSIRESLSHFLFERTKRRPMILPVIMEI